MGKLFKALGFAVFFVGGAWGLLVCLGIIRAALGTFGLLISLFFFPITMALAPFYAALAKGNWFPLVLVYGSGVVATLLTTIGRTIDKDHD